MSQPILDNSSIQMQPVTWLFTLMSTESLNRTSDVIETPSQETDTINVLELDVLKPRAKTFETTLIEKKTSKRVKIDVLKQRLYEEKKKEKVKRTIILSSVIVSLGALTMLTY